MPFDYVGTIYGVNIYETNEYTNLIFVDETNRGGGISLVINQVYMYTLQTYICTVPTVRTDLAGFQHVHLFIYL